MCSRCRRSRGAPPIWGLKVDVDALPKALQAQLNRHRVPARLLAHYAGTYGERTLTVRGDTLMFRRVPYPPHALIALDDSTFALAMVERITLEREGARPPRLRLVRENGDTVRAARTGPPPP